MKKYKRDGRAPVPKSETTSRVMSANKDRNTKPELILRKALWSKGLKGYRLHPKKIPGKPDIVYNRKKVAIFVNGCYWHRCPKCDLPVPKSNSEFWRRKFSKNKERDNQKLKSLKESGWNTIVVWECEIKKDLESIIGKIRKELNG